jgi:para-aminobenzoate synthetase/4-amino-4-deoxychorismate lyase
MESTGSRTLFPLMTPDSPPTFRLLETLRLDHGVVVRRERHLRRLEQAARHFGFAWAQPRIEAALVEAAAAAPAGIHRLRLLADAAGAVEVSCTPHVDSSTMPWRVAFANAPIDSADPFLRHKTTQREAYDTARRGRPDVDDVLLWNERRELTESTIANVVVEIAGGRWTPAVNAGLLPGILRGELLETGAIRERVITRGEVVRAERLWLINSLRGWIEAVLVR